MTVERFHASTRHLLGPLANDLTGHELVTMVRHGSAVGADEADVCRHSDEFAVALHHDDLTILIRGVRIGSPTKESGDNLTDFCEPWDRSVTDVDVRLRDVGALSQ